MVKQKKKQSETKKEDSATDLVDYLSAGYSEAPVIDPAKPIDDIQPSLGTPLSDTTSTNPEPGKTRKPYTKRKKEGEDDGEPIIDGEMLVEFIDIFIPALICMVHNNLVKDGVKISPDELDATEKQKLKMIKFANRCAEKLNMNVNPFVGLGITMIGCYGMKYFQAKNK